MLMRRLLMDPDPAGTQAGGGGNPPPAQPPNPNPANPPTQPTAPTPGQPTNPPPAPQPGGPGQPPPHGVMLTLDQYNELLAAQARDREAQAARQTQAEQERQAEIDRARRNNDAAEALRLQEANHQRAIEAERNARLNAENAVVVANRRELDATARMAVAAALATRTFINDAARAQAESLLFHHVEAVRDGDVVVVRQRGTTTPAAEYLNQVLSGPEYAHFLASRTTPATTTTQGTTTAQSGNAPVHPNPLMAALFDNTRQTMSGQTGEAVGLSGHRGRN